MSKHPRTTTSPPSRTYSDSEQYSDDGSPPPAQGHLKIKHLRPKISLTFGPSPSDGSRGLPNALKKLHSKLPVRMEHNKWLLMFMTSPYSPGVMADLQATCNSFKTKCSGFLAVIEDFQGQLFGFFTAQPLFDTPTFPGGEEGFLYRLGFGDKHCNGPTVLHQKERFSQISCPDSISLVDENERAGLYIHKSLKCGYSKSCESFKNTPLFKTESFNITCLQIFALIPPWSYQELLKW